MKKLLSLIMILFAVTVFYKDGGHQVYHWSNGFEEQKDGYFLYSSVANRNGKIVTYNKTMYISKKIVKKVVMS